jgi:ubiquinone/menaquinone biosynthesis C-methylase UbiE
MSMFQEFYDAGAEGYGVIFARVPEHFRTTLLRQARVSTGRTMLDVATGTGIVAEAAAQIVGHSGSVIGVDVSRGMLAVAERRLAPLRNVTIKVMDAQALDLPDASVDTITCSLALMLFPDPAQALGEMHRVLRPNGYVSTSVLTTPAQSLTANIQDVIGRYCPERAAAAAQYFSLGDSNLLCQLLATVGFEKIEVFPESKKFPFASFDAYYNPIEQGAGSVGAELASLPVDVRRAIRNDVWRDIGSPAADVPIELEVTLLFASGRKLRPAP